MPLLDADSVTLSFLSMRNKEFEFVFHHYSLVWNKRLMSIRVTISTAQISGLRLFLSIDIIQMK